MAKVSMTAAVRLPSYPDLKVQSKVAALRFGEEVVFWLSPGEGKTDMVVKIS